MLTDIFMELAAVKHQSRIEALTSEANYIGEAISKKRNWAAKVSLEQGIASLIAQMEL